MIKLSDGRNELFQYDTGRTVEIEGVIKQFHFSNNVYGRTLDVDAENLDGKSVAKVPDLLLQSPADLRVYAFVGSGLDAYTKIEQTFKVIARNKPNDYVFTPTEQKTIKEIEATANKAETIAQSVRDDADAGKFKGAKGDKGEKGDTGAKGDKGDTGEVPTEYINQNFANALKGNANGEVISVDDVSPIEHNVTCKLTSDTITDFSSILLMATNMKYGYYYDFSGNIHEAKDYFILDEYIPLSEGKEILISGVIDTIVKNQVLVIYDENKKRIDWWNANENRHIPIKANYKFARFSLHKENMSNYKIEVTGTKISVPSVSSTYIPNADGIVNGIKSIAPNMTLFSDTDGVNLEVEYNRDINKAFAELEKKLK